MSSPTPPQTGSHNTSIGFYEAPSRVSKETFEKIYFRVRSKFSSNMNALLSSIVLFAEGDAFQSSISPDEIKSALVSLPKEDESAAEPYKTIYSVMHDSLGLGNTPGTRPFPNTTDSYQSLLKFLDGLNQQVQPDEIRLPQEELEHLAFQCRVLGIADPKQVDEDSSAWDLETFRVYCTLFRHRRQAMSKRWGPGP